MKKFFIILLVLVVCLTNVFAYQNTYNAESSEYKTLKMLAKLSGKSTVNMTSPISSEQMLIIMDMIDTSKLNDTAMRYYSNLRHELENPEVSVKVAEDAGVLAKVEASYQYIKQAENETDFFLSKKDRSPMVLFGADMYFKDFLYGVFDFDLTDINNGYIPEEGKYAQITNNLVKSFAWGEAFDWSMPHRAFASLGYKGTNLIVGRDKLSLGTGKTGNLSLSDNLWYNDFVKASVLSGKLSYDFTAMYFSDSTGKTEAEHLANPLSIDYNGRYEMDKDYNQFVILHNISYAPADFINLSINEGALIYRNSLGIDLRNYNPFMIIHNVFHYQAGWGHNAGNMNNFFGGQIDVTLPNGVGISAQAVADQIQLSGEIGDENLPQPAFGVLLDATKAFTALNGIGEAYIEGVYTSPNLYLKEVDVACQKYWNLDLIVGNKYVEPYSDVDELSYLGYKYGPSTIAFGCGFDWFNNAGITVDCDATMVMHGNQGIRFYEGQNDKTVTYGESVNKVDLISGDVTEFKLAAGLKVSYTPFDWVTVSGAINYMKAWNYRNIKGESFNDYQFAIGATIRGLEFSKLKKPL